MVLPWQQKQKTRTKEGLKKKKISEHKENKDNKTCAFYCRLVLDFGYYDASSQLKIAIFYSMCAFALLKNILKCSDGLSGSKANNPYCRYYACL